MNDLQNTDNNQNQIKENEKQANPRLIGASILGWLNLIFFGVISFFIFFSVLSRPSSGIAETLSMVFQEKGIAIDFKTPIFKIAILFQILLSIVFIISGIGILQKKEWGRKLTIYFSFLLLFIIAVGVFLNFALIAQAILQIIYPGILIFYFTNKQVEKAFN